ncbi:hypothetical protein JKY72_06005 [Candidatus Gracilibacteria bacterium]|nr:hypothetical protein [Candidatus Gracilibacteria bacterium]
MSGDPEWWTGPNQTGRQLLSHTMFAEQFVAEDTTADIRAIRSIVFQMLGMDHLVFFIDVCCNNLEPDVDALTPVENVIISEEKHTEALKAPAVTRIKAKKKGFNVSNIRRLLGFALECGLKLGQTTQHMTPREHRRRGINPFDLCNISIRGHELGNVNTIEMLTQLRLQEAHIDGTVCRAILSCTSFNMGSIIDESNVILQPRTRLHPEDSGSAVWFNVLDMLFVYHQNASPMSSSFDILTECLSISRVNILCVLVDANKCDEQRRLLPYLLRKPDLNDGKLILMFCADTFNFGNIDNIDYIIACAELCCEHPNWPQTCVKLINCLFMKRKHFIANVKRLPGVNVESQADIVAYIFANMNGVQDISCHLIIFMAEYGAFDTTVSIDYMMGMLRRNGFGYFASEAAMSFAYRLGSTQPVTERIILYKRYFEHAKYSQRPTAIIHYLMHHKSLYFKYSRLQRCSLHVGDFLELELDNRTIVSVKCPRHLDGRETPYGYLTANIRELCDKKIHMDSHTCCLV